MRSAARLSMVVFILFICSYTVADNEEQRTLKEEVKKALLKIGSDSWRNIELAEKVVSILIKYPSISKDVFDEVYEEDRFLLATSWLFLVRIMRKREIDKVVPILKNMLGCKQNYLKLQAAYELAIRNNDTGKPVLKSLLPDERWQLTASAGLAHLGDRSGLPYLLRNLASEYHRYRLVAFDALKNIVNRSDVDDLKEIIEEKPDRSDLLARRYVLVLLQSMNIDVENPTLSYWLKRFPLLAQNELLRVRGDIPKDEGCRLLNMLTSFIDECGRKWRFALRPKPLNLLVISDIDLYVESLLTHQNRSHPEPWRYNFWTEEILFSVWEPGCAPMYHYLIKYAISSKIMNESLSDKLQSCLMSGLTLYITGKSDKGLIVPMTHWQESVQILLDTSPIPLNEVVGGLVEEADMTASPSLLAFSLFAYIFKHHHKQALNLLAKARDGRLETDDFLFLLNKKEDGLSSHNLISEMLIGSSVETSRMEFLFSKGLEGNKDIALDTEPFFPNYPIPSLFVFARLMKENPHFALKKRTLMAIYLSRAKSKFLLRFAIECLNLPKEAFLHSFVGFGLIKDKMENGEDFLFTEDAYTRLKKWWRENWKYLWWDEGRLKVDETSRKKAVSINEQTKRPLSQPAERFFEELNNKFELLLKEMSDKINKK